MLVKIAWARDTGGMDSEGQSGPAAQWKPQRRWLQFSIKSLLLLMVVYGAMLALIANPALKQRRAVAAIESLGGCVTYDSDALSRAPTSWLPRNYFGRVVRVQLEGIRCTDDSLAHLAALPHLREISLHCPRVTDAGLVHLRNLNWLVRVDLDNTRVTDKGIAELTNRKLVYLSLRDTNLTDMGLAELKTESALQELRLDGTQVTDSGLLHLRCAMWLEAISLDGTQVTDHGFEALLEAIPHCARRSREWRFGVRQSTLD
jgi:hypothetical protein